MKQSSIGFTWTQVRRGVMPRIVSARYCDRLPSGLTSHVIHKLWALDYARADCGQVRVGSPRAAWRWRAARVAHLYPPETPYWEDTRTVRGLIREGWVVFAGGEKAGLGSLLGRGQRCVRIVDPAGRLDPLLHEIARAGEASGEAGFWQAQGRLADVFDLLGSLRAAEPGGDEFVLPAAGAAVSEDEGVVAAAQRYFRSHLSERITLASMARQLRMSASTLSHRYAAEAGQSPMAALVALRIELAKSLILRGLKMEMVARQTGFYDGYHLSKSFKKHCGTTASAFRRTFWRSAHRGS